MNAKNIWTGNAIIIDCNLPLLITGQLHIHVKSQIRKTQKNYQIGDSILSYIVACWAFLRFFNLLTFFNSTHFSRIEFPTLINWTSLFLF